MKLRLFSFGAGLALTTAILLAAAPAHGPVMEPDMAVSPYPSPSVSVMEPEPASSPTGVPTVAPSPQEIPAPSPEPTLAEPVPDGDIFTDCGGGLWVTESECDALIAEEAEMNTEPAEGEPGFDCRVHDDRVCDIEIEGDLYGVDFEIMEIVEY